MSLSGNTNTVSRKSKELDANDGEKRTELFRQSTDLEIEIHGLKKVITRNENNI